MAGIGNRVLLSLLRSPASRRRAEDGPATGAVVPSSGAGRWWRFWRPTPEAATPGPGRGADGVGPLRGTRLFRTWLPVVAAAELAGFAVPAVTGVVTASAPGATALVALTLAGAVEGALLGWGQASVLRRALAGFPVRRWIGHTAAAAALAYVLGMLPSATGAWWVAAVTGVPLLLSIGVAQWWVLRGRVGWARRWIGVTAAAWLAGLAVFLAFATPLWQVGQPLALTVLIGLAGGALMATTVAAVTGLALRGYLR